MSRSKYSAEIRTKVAQECIDIDGIGSISLLVKKYKIDFMTLSKLDFI